MPLHNGKLTGKERVFRDTLAGTGDKTYAAAKAGYAFPGIDGHKVLARPGMAEAVADVQAKRVTNELLPLAVDLLHKYLTDDTRNDRIRLGAVQIVMKYSLGGKDEGETKEPHEMTPQELQARIDTLRRAMADKARPVIEGQASEPEPGVFD